jgi:hypothetical protein
LAADGVLLLGLLWYLLQVLGSILPLLPRLPVAGAGNKPLISGLSDIDLNLFASSHSNYQVPDLKEYPPLIQREAPSSAIAIQKTVF